MSCKQESGRGAGESVDEQDRKINESENSEESSANDEIGGVDYVDDPSMTPEIRLSRCTQRGKWLTNERKFDEAVDETIKCVVLCRLVFGDEHWRHAAACCDLAHSYLQCREMNQQALKHSERAGKILLASQYAAVSQEETAGSTSNDQMSNISLLLAKVYRVQGQAWLLMKNFARSDNALQKALMLLKKLSPNSTIETELTLSVIKLLGVVSRKRGKTGQAMEYFEKCIELVEATYGAQSVELIPFYKELARTEQVNRSRSTPERVLQHYETALQLSELAFGDSSVTFADCLLLIANTLISLERSGERVKQFALAEKYLLKGITIYESVLGRGCRKHLSAQDALISLKIQDNNLSEATDILLSALAARKQTHGPQSEQVAECYKRLGAIYLSENNIPSASKSLVKAQGIYYHVVGPNHRKYKDIVALVEVVKRNPTVRQQFQHGSENLRDRPRFTANVKHQQIPALF